MTIVFTLVAAKFLDSMGRVRNGWAVVIYFWNAILI